MNELNKSVTLGRGVVLAVLMVIGSGLLGLPGLVADIGTVDDVVFGWLFIILATMPLIQVCIRLGVKYPCTGGLFQYAREAVGEWGGYAVTALACGSFILGEPAIALIGGEYIQHLFDMPDYGAHIIAFFLITVMTFTTIAGVRLVSVFNYVAVTVLLFLIGTIVVFNSDLFTSGVLFSARALYEGISGLEKASGHLNLCSIWNISALLFWAFQGWENMSFGLGELKDPEKNVSKVFWYSFVFTIFIYLTLAATSIGADAGGVPLTGASGLAELVKFTPHGRVLIWLMAIVIVANMTSWNFASSCLLYASGKEEVLPAYLGKLSSKGQPVASILSMYAVFVLVLLGTYVFRVPISALLMLVNQNYLLIYGFILLSYWKVETGWRRWVYSTLSLLSLSFLVSGFTWRILYSIALTGLGYYGFLRNAKKQKIREVREEKGRVSNYRGHVNSGHVNSGHVNTGDLVSLEISVKSGSE